MGMKQDCAVGCVFGDFALAAPVDEDVSVGQGLEIPLGFCGDLGRGYEFLDEGGSFVDVIERDVFAP